MTNYPVVRYRSSPTGGNAEFNTLRNGLFLDPATSLPGTARELRRGWYPSRVVKWVRSAGRILFANCRNLIMQSTDDGSTWATSLSVTGGDTSTNNSASNFAMVVGSDNQPYLVTGCRYQFNGNIICRWDGTSWLEEGAFGTDNPIIFGYESKAILAGTTSFGGATSGCTIYDPVTRARTSANFPLTPQNQRVGTFFTLNKRLFYAIQVTSGVTLFEFTLGVWVTIANPFISYMHNTAGSTACTIGAIKLSGSKVLLFAAGDNGGGFGLECALVTLVSGAPAQTRVTNPVVPPFLRGPSSVGAPNTYSLHGFADNAETPGSPRHYLWFDPSANTASGAVSLLEVFDEATELSIVGTSQISNDYGLPAFGGGQFVFTPGELSIQLIDQIRDSQGLRLQYRCAGDPGTANKIASFRYVNNFGIPVGVCTLVPGSAVGGGTVVGNTVTGIDADPTITHEVVWDFLSDGVPDGTYLHDQAFLAAP